MNTIAQLFTDLPDPELLSKQVEDCQKFVQDESFFHLAVAKDARIATLKEYFSRNGLRKVYLCAHLSGYKYELDGIEVEILEENFFQESDPVRCKAKKTLLDGCVVIINSSVMLPAEVAVAYVQLFEYCTATCFIAWDHDNHHLLSRAVMQAAYSDIYVPAHHENLYLLSRYNWLITAPVYAASFQWPRKFLTEHLPEMLMAERSDAPLGMHFYYPPFTFRNQVIISLNQHYSSIGFLNNPYHSRRLEDRLKEWCSHKSHWITPVLSDVPTRLFDALSTGGVPIVPSSHRFLPPLHSIPCGHVVFYSPADILNPKPVVERANKLFDEGGRDGIATRHRLALQYGDAVRQMLSFAAEVLEIKVTW